MYPGGNHPDHDGKAYSLYENSFLHGSLLE
jgi:hypothetical protein